MSDRLAGQYELLARARRNDAVAIEDLLRLHEPLVRAFVRKFRLGRLDRDDALQAGRIGLWKAILRYDPRFGTCFSTYAIWWIRVAVRRARQDTCVISIPRARQDRGLSGPEVDLIGLPWAIEDLRHGGEPDGQAIDLKIDRQRLRRRISRLPKRERSILRERLRGKSLRSIALVLGVSVERVRQLEKRAVGRLTGASA